MLGTGLTDRFRPHPVQGTSPDFIPKLTADAKAAGYIDEIVPVNGGAALRLAREVMARRGLAGAAFNAAKEVALDHFLAGGVGFMQMSHIVEETLSALDPDLGRENAAMTLEDVQSIDHLARIRAGEIARGLRQESR